jgi:transcriptional accessory protein Tex/SPT6
MPAAGTLVPGKVVSVSGSGVLVQLGAKQQGLVALTDIHDHWVPNALSGVSSGTFVQARVLTALGSRAAAAKPRQGQAAEKQKLLTDPKGRIMLSLRPSLGGSIAAAAAADQGSAAAAAAAEVNMSGLKVGSKVRAGRARS